jgi:hypothetical protein
MIDYTVFPDLVGIYLEDSYVLAINDSGGELTFRLDAVITTENPAYHEPRPGEHHCYAERNLTFASATSIEWVSRSDRCYADATGEVDHGSIDVLTCDGEAFVVEGDWGRFRVVSAPPRFELGS